MDDLKVIFYIILAIVIGASVLARFLSGREEGK